MPDLECRSIAHRVECRVVQQFLHVSVLTLDISKQRRMVGCHCAATCARGRVGMCLSRHAPCTRGMIVLAVSTLPGTQAGNRLHAATAMKRLDCSREARPHPDQFLMHSPDDNAMHHCFRWLLCMSVALTLLVTSTRADAQDAAATVKHWPGWQIAAGKVGDDTPLTIRQDDDAESTRTVTEGEGDAAEEVQQHTALVQRVSRRQIAKVKELRLAVTPLVKWEEVEPGIYDIKARIKYDGDTGVIGTPIVLGVEVEGAGGRGAERGFQPCDMDEPDVYQIVSFRFEVSPEGDKRLAARQTRYAGRPGTWIDEAYPNRAKASSTPSSAKARVPPGFRVYIELPQTKYDVKSGRPPNHLRSVSVDWVRIEKVDPSPSITVRYVRPQLLWNRPDRKNKFHISLENFTDQAQTRTLRVALTGGLFDERVVASHEVTLDAGASQVIEVDWAPDANTDRWGHEVNASIMRGQKVESFARDYFGVHPRVYDIHVNGTRIRSVDPFRHPESMKNITEVFGATWGDCAGIMPPGDEWVQGMLGSGAVHSFKLVNAMVDGNAAQGIASHMYLYAGGTGTALMDLAVKHPEWIASRVVAPDNLYAKRAAREQEIADHDWEANGHPGGGGQVPHIEQHLKHQFPELKAKIEREAVEFVKRSRYMGIRFDVGIFAPGGTRTVLGTPTGIDVGDPHKHAAKNFKDFRAKMLEVDPHFEFGANMDSYAYLDHVGLRDVTPPPAEEYAEFVAFANAHGMFMDEGTMNAPLFRHPMNRWEDAVYGIAQRTQMARRYGGVYQTFSPHRDGSGHFAHDDIYWAIINIACGSHYYGSFAAPPYSNASVGQFITRFSEFFYDPRLRHIDDAYDRIFADTLAELWYTDTAVAADLSDGRKRYVIPLINPPVVERLRRNKVCELPPAIDEAFPLEIAMPNGFSKATATLLTWEPDVRAKPLVCTVDAGNATVTCPPFKLFQVVVVEFEK